MTESLLAELAGVVVLGVAAQWLAWWIRIPSILLLLVFGVLAGQVCGWLHPDEMFGKALSPFVSIAVALILYEGGLSLKISELRQVGAVCVSLVSVGALITWLIGAVSAVFIFDMDVRSASVLGAVLVVTGPTVVGPLLQHIRPYGVVGPILKWEGIVIDPIGAVAAVLVYEAVFLGGTTQGGAFAVVGVVRTIVIGGGMGFVAGIVLTLCLQRHRIADHLENAVSLMFVVAVASVCNYLESESGLLAATVMGFTLANQKKADVEHIVEFKENLRVLLIACLFIVLAARVDLTALREVMLRGVLFAALLILVARPLSVLAATFKTALNLKERMFIAWMAPRGIVAAAVASVFALRLEQQDIEGASMLVPITFVVIIATVSVYGVTSPLLARVLRLAEASPQGLLIVGADGWARELGLLLKSEGIRVLLVDSNRQNANAARLAGLATYHGSILADHALDHLDLGGIGRLLAVTPNDWVNALAVHRFERLFGRAACYQLPPQERGSKKQRHKYLHGRWLFGDDVSHRELQRRAAEGYTAKATKLTDEFDYAAFRRAYGESARVLFALNSEGRLNVMTADAAYEPGPGDTVISLVKEPT